jgi:hypothetical protein
MIATFTGSIYAEASCTALAATVNLMDCETYTSVVSAPVTFIAPAEGSLVWTFKIEVSAPNNFGYFYGALAATDATNAADKEDMDASCNLWSPPCYLDVVTFGKVGQEESLDHMKTHLDYTIALTNHGDNACNTTSAVLTLQNGTSDSFRMQLDGTDFDSAMTAGGFNMSVAIASDAATGATITMTDKNAAVDASATGAGFVIPADVNCAVLVSDFCIETATEIADGRYEFNFTIRVESNSKCGTLSASMDII